MAKKKGPPDPGRRRFFRDLFALIGREAGKAHREFRKAREELEEIAQELEESLAPPPVLESELPADEDLSQADLAAVEARLEELEEELERLQAQLRALGQDPEVSSGLPAADQALLQQLVAILARQQVLLSQEPVALEADTPETQEVKARWQGARGRLWDLVKLVLAGLGVRTAEALYEAVVSEEVYPWVKRQWQGFFARAEAEGVIEQSPLPSPTGEAPPSEAPTPEPETPTPQDRPRRRPRRRGGILVPELVPVPGGSFWMGSDKRYDKDAWDDELPQHRLRLSAYRIGKYPVTNAEYADFVRATGHRAPEHWSENVPPKHLLDHPVVYVTWGDAQAYCRWLRERTGLPFRLPSEAEWEKAARGSDGRIWPWGNRPPDASRCNFGRNVGGATPVGSYPKGVSPYGCYDMAGNVWEWTRSLMRGYPYRADDGREDENAEGPRVVRGGSWFDSPRFVRCAFRDWYYPYYRLDDRGFRVVAPGL